MLLKLCWFLCSCWFCFFLKPLALFRDFFAMVLRSFFSASACGLVSIREGGSKKQAQRIFDQSPFESLGGSQTFGC